uniref:Uncharacterized protein MANES_01G049300 n=1 Tax=Rhizophora mucronata TaxID=61149 RepID=A0A2P2JT58_RHIMU
MDDDFRKIKIVPDHFEVSTSGEDPQSNTPTEPSRIDSSSRIGCRHWAGRKLRSAAFMLNLFSLRGLPWVSGTGGQEKVELTAAELESLRSGLADLEEREAYLKAQLEHVDEILRSARLSGYLYIRTVVNFTYLPSCFLIHTAETLHTLMS